MIEVRTQGFADLTAIREECRRLLDRNDRLIRAAGDESIQSDSTKAAVFTLKTESDRTRRLLGEVNVEIRRRITGGAK